MEKKHLQILEIPYQLKQPINHLKRTEVQEVINSINPKKSSGYNPITSKILKELPIIGIKYLTVIQCRPTQRVLPAKWKVAQIIFILKPGKPPNELISYMPINLLPIVSKIFKKLLLKRFLPIAEINRLMTNHQLGILYCSILLH
jgi:hypothetical protein